MTRPEADAVRADPRAAVAFAGLLLPALPARAAGQRCHVDRSPDPDDWHDGTRAERELRRRRHDPPPGPPPR